MKLSKDNTINLEDFRAKDGHKISKVFTGIDRGLYVREQSKIDEIEQSYDEVKIIIPNNIYSINPSFFEEQLGLHRTIISEEQNFFVIHAL